MSISLTSRQQGDWLREPELVHLRREWVRAYQAWRRSVDEATSLDRASTDEQREAERSYQAAENAYFARSRMLGDR